MSTQCQCGHDMRSHRQGEGDCKLCQCPQFTPISTLTESEVAPCDPSLSRGSSAAVPPSDPAGRAATARIFTRCPSCGNDTLTINKGHLLCTWRECKDPCAIETGFDRLTAELAQAQATLTTILTDVDYEGGIQSWTRKYNELSLSALQIIQDNAATVEENVKLKTELAKTKDALSTACRDWADDDTRVKEIAESVGVQGESADDYFRTVVDVAEDMAKMLTEARAERDRLYAQTKKDEQTIQFLDQERMDFAESSLKHIDECDEARSELAQARKGLSDCEAENKSCEEIIEKRNSELAQAREELNKAWITQGDIREQSEVLKDERDSLQARLAESELERERMRAELRDATCGRCVCVGCSRTVNNAWRDSNGHWCLTCLSSRIDALSAALRDMLEVYGNGADGDGEEDLVDYAKRVLSDQPSGTLEKVRTFLSRAHYFFTNECPNGQMQQWCEEALALIGEPKERP